MAIPTQVIVVLKSTEMEILGIEFKLNGQEAPLNLLSIAFHNQDDL
jgi:hypothetical protein